MSKALASIRQQIERLPRPIRESLIPRLRDTVDEATTTQMTEELKRALDRLPGLVEDLYAAARHAPAALPPNVSSRFHLVNIVAPRAEQLVAGARPKIETGHVKAARIALAEVLAGEVRWNVAEELETEVAEQLAASDGEGAALEERNPDVARVRHLTLSA